MNTGNDISNTWHTSHQGHKIAMATKWKETLLVLVGVIRKGFIERLQYVLILKG